MYLYSLAGLGLQYLNLYQYSFSYFLSCWIPMYLYSLADLGLQYLNLY